MIEEHIVLSILKTSIKLYFTMSTEYYDWINNPFWCYNKLENLLLKEKKRLIDIAM